MSRLAAQPPEPPLAVRVVVDARPIQEPERAPLTAWYLDQLLHAFAAEPLEGESFVIISRALREAPAEELRADGLPVSATRTIPPTTRALRSAGLTLDSFLLRGAQLGATSTEMPSVFHTAGGAVPLASDLPVVATLLDLAPWELPGTYAANAAARFGHRLRARVLRDAARVIVCSRAVADSARRRLHIPVERLVVVPLAVDAAYRAAARDSQRLAQLRDELALPERYLAFSGRYDARKDMRTLFEALERARPSAPLLVVGLEGERAEEREHLQRAIGSAGVSDLVRVIGINGPEQRAALLAGSQALVYPALSEATALPALEALAVGTPVICSRAGALPESVGSAGIVVEPRDAARMAAAIEALWATGSLAQQLHRQARRRAEAAPRTWSHIARETRLAYAAAARATPTGTSETGRLRSALGRFALR